MKRFRGMRQLFFLFTSLLFGSFPCMSAEVSAEACADTSAYASISDKETLDTLVQQKLISSRAARIILQASTTQFRVQVLINKNAKEPKAVVFLGENHACKSQITNAAGEAVVDEFSFRGYESVQANSCISKAAICCLLPVLHTLYSCSQLCTRSESVIFLSNARPIENLKAVWLEEDHAPSCAENLTYAECATYFGSCITSTILDALIPGSVVIKPLTFLTYAVGYGCLWGATFAGCAIEEYADDESNTDYIRWCGGNGLVVDRNKTMTANIVKAFQDNPERKAMLVAVGAAHVQGISRMLVRDHGFTRVELSLSQEKLADVASSSTSAIKNPLMNQEIRER